MAENLEKKILIDVKLASEGARTEMKALANDIKALNESAINLQTATTQSEKAVAHLSEQLAQSKLTTQQYREEIARLALERKKEIEVTNAAKKAVVAAAGSYDEAQKKLTALGRAIKSAENGFESTSPKIQQQIKEYRELNAKLTAFDKQLGNHQRNIGNYQSALDGLSGSLTRLIPGYDQLSSILKVATQGFSAMNGGVDAANKGLSQTGESASSAEGGIEGATGALGGIAAAILIVIAGLVVLAKHFTDLTPNADSLSQRWAYMKGLFRAFADDIGKGVGFGQLYDDMTKAAQAAANLTMAMQDLERAKKQDIVDDAKADAQIAELNLKMRNRRNTIAQEKSYYDQIQKISQDKYEGNKKLADLEYQLAIKRAINSNRFSEEEKARLMKDGIEYAIILDKMKGLVNGEDDLKAITEAQQRQIATDREKEMIHERSQNRLDAVELRGEQAAQKEEQQIAKIKQETESANSERLASIVRTLDFQRQAFSKELSDTDEHYRQLIFKQRKFIEDMQVIADSKKSTTKEKSAARKGITVGRNTIGTITQEQSAAQQKLLEDHNKKILELTQKSANDLSTLQISAIKDAEERERQSENLSYKEKQQGLQREIILLKEDQSKLNKEIKTATGERLEILKQELTNTQALIGVANDKKVENQLQHQEKLKKIIKDFFNQRKLLEDEANIIKTGQFGSSPDQKANYKAQQQELDDNHNINLKKLTDGEITANEFLKIDEQYISDSNALKYKAAQDLKQFELKTAQEVAGASFQILEQSLQRQTQANDMYLQRQKAHDLSNQSLTETQKYVINEKYRVLEGKAKVKAFHQQQELDLAKAVISGALAIVAAEEQPYIAPFVIPGIIITTALQLATIASQKAPAYAQGGLHYNSDGKGGVLPGYSKTDNTNAYLRSGEAVVVSEAMRDPWARNLVSAINTSYGGRSFDTNVPVSSWVRPGFAPGGVFNTYLPVGDNGLRPQMSAGNGRLHPEDIGNIVNGFALAVSNIPAPVTDIKDVAYQQNRYSKVYDRLNY